MSHRHLKIRVVHCPAPPVRIAYRECIMEFMEGEEAEVFLATPQLAKSPPKP